MIKNLGMPLGVIAVYSIIAGTVNLLVQPLWGRVIDRLGNKPVLVFNMLGIFFLPLFWLFAGPGFYLPIWIDAFLTGIFWPGFGLATFNLLLISAPEGDRQPYLAVQNVATGLSVFLASLAGGALAKWMGGVHVRFLGLDLVNFHLLFALSSLLRLAILPLALRLPEERAGSVGALLDLMGNKASQAFSESLRSGVMVVRKLKRK
jgi:MFS family permease